MHIHVPGSTTRADHDFDLLYDGSEQKVLALSPHYFIMEMFRHLPALNAITALPAEMATDLSAEAQLEVFGLQSILYDVFAEAFGKRPDIVQAMVLQMTGHLFHVQYWPRYKDGVTILDRHIVDHDFADRRITSRLRKGESLAEQFAQQTFLEDNAATIRTQLSTAFMNVAGTATM